ncbi:MAG: helix-turn-helix transcriptional regulator [Solirubrobacterales bacterium]|nr:helix-turn-helix transcriptional regulator [Solirubrobacterales bacterium]
MKPGATLENLTAAIVESCRSGLSPEALRDQVLTRLRRAVPFDAAFWSTVDPTTMLQTRPHQDGIPAETIPYFIENEFFEADVNKWTGLAAHRLGVRTLAQATGGEMEASPRYRDIFRPLGFGDELRAVFRVGGACWGYMCLHREAGTPFSHHEVAYVHRLAPHVAEGIRAGILIASTELASGGDSPGLVLVASDGSLLSATEAGERWLEELADHVREGSDVPIPVLTLAARLQGADASSGELPKLRVQTRAGRWAVLHASRMTTSGTDAVAVIIDEPSPAELAPVILMAYGLTKQEQVLTALVCRGLSTGAIAERLHITPNTIQEHLKSIFEKTGVSSRRELVATILQEQYMPRVMANKPIGPSGFFT